MDDETSRRRHKCETIGYKEEQDMNPKRICLLGSFLRDRREELGLSAREVGRRSGVNYQTVIRIENAEFDRPGADKLKAIAEALELTMTTVWDILGYSDAGLPEPMPYLRAKFRDMPPGDLAALSQDVARVLKDHGIESSGRPAPGEDEFDEPDFTASSPSKGGTS
jgi:transcriptional regulator with XRE-family HTH domain